MIKIFITLLIGAKIGVVCRKYCEYKRKREKDVYKRIKREYRRRESIREFMRECCI